MEGNSSLYSRHCSNLQSCRHAAWNTGAAAGQASKLSVGIVSSVGAGVVGAIWASACWLTVRACTAGIAPYMALELASYDLMPSEVPGFAKGFTAALFATSLCYPLDTVR